MIKKDNLDLEIMRFRPDKLSSFLVMVFAVLNVWLTLNSVNKMEYEIRVFLFSMYNIILTLVVLMASSMVKMYKYQWSIGLIVIAVLQFLRMAVIPEHTATGLNITLYAVSASIILLAGLYSLWVSLQRKKHIEAIKLREEE